MAPAFSLFHVSPDGYTFLLNGHTVTSLSYPALSFLLYVPLLLAGWSTQMAVAVNVLAWAVGIVLTFVLLPRPLRPLAIVVGSFAVYISYAVGGVTDALFVPLLIGAVYRWDRFAHERGLVAWRGPILLGLAMAVKQTPWLVLPFLVAGMALEACRPGGRRRPDCRTGGRYLAIALAAFAVPNLPFVFGSPHAWLTGMLTPIASHTVPAGQGLVGTHPLPRSRGRVAGRLHGRPGGGVRRPVGRSSWSPIRASRLWAVIVPGAGAVLLRPLVRELPGHPPARRPGGGHVDPAVRTPSADRWRPGAPCGPMGGGRRGVVGLLVPWEPSSPRRRPWPSGSPRCAPPGSWPPWSSSGSRSRTARAAPRPRPSPSRAAASSPPSGRPVAGPVRRWRRGQRAHYTLLAPNFFAQPPITGGFQVVAFTSPPATVSVSRSYLPTTSTWASTRTRSAASSRSASRSCCGPPSSTRSTGRCAESGVPVYLGQVIYGQQGLVFGQAIINQGQVGQTPVVAYTDAARRRHLRRPGHPGVGRSGLLRGQPGQPAPVLPVRVLGDRPHPVRGAADWPAVDHRRAAPTPAAVPGPEGPRTAGTGGRTLTRAVRVAWVVFGLQLVAMMAWSVAAVQPMGDDLGLRYPVPGLVGDRPRESRPATSTVAHRYFWQDHFELINWPLAPLSWLWPGGLWTLWIQDLMVVGRRAGRALPGGRRGAAARGGPADCPGGGGRPGDRAARGQPVDLRQHLVRLPLPVGRGRLLRHAGLPGDDPGGDAACSSCGWCCAWPAATSPAPTSPRSGLGGMLAGRAYRRRGAALLAVGAGWFVLSPARPVAGRDRA